MWHIPPRVCRELSADDYDSLLALDDSVRNHKGASATEVARLPRTHFVPPSCSAASSDTEPAQCCICLSAIEAGEVVKWLPCAHVFHADCIDAVARAAAKLGYSNMPVVSGAGHDAIYMTKLAPSGMIFIPCKDGISHNEIEDAKPEHIEAGGNVLLHAMLDRAKIAR